MTQRQTIQNSIIIRPAFERGRADHGWLHSYHTFSFGEYHDPKHMSFRALRVINEDWVEAGMGFGMHPHQNMEIFTYVVEGALQHKDSMGHESVIKPGFVQKMTAGTGIMHSEFNPSKKEPVHLLQIWIVPAQKGLKPSYQEIALLPPDPQNPLVLIGSPQGGESVLQFNQDVYIYRGTMPKNAQAVHPLKSGRGAWVQLIKGKVNLNGHGLSAGDGASIESLESISFKATEDAEFLMFDLN